MKKTVIAVIAGLTLVNPTIAMTTQEYNNIESKLKRSVSEVRVLTAFNECKGQLTSEGTMYKDITKICLCYAEKEITYQDKILEEETKTGLVHKYWTDHLFYLKKNFSILDECRSN